MDRRRRTCPRCVVDQATANLVIMLPGPAQRIATKGRRRRTGPSHAVDPAITCLTDQIYKRSSSWRQSSSLTHQRKLSVSHIFNIFQPPNTATMLSKLAQLSVLSALAAKLAAAQDNNGAPFNFCTDDNCQNCPVALTSAGTVRIS
jgi:hypothetical protein